jgi:two-component system, NarL family, sensor histidine kinase DegS
MKRSDPVDANSPTYTRSPMETGTLGTTRPLNLDALVAEAAQTIAGAAAHIHELTALLRAGYENALSDASLSPAAATGGTDLASGRQLLGRLELAERSVREAATLIEGGVKPVGRLGNETASQRFALLAAQEEERARLANELHDGPAQALANLIFQTEVVDRAVRSDAEAGEQELRALRQMLQAELETIRAYINQLRPPLIDSEGLDEALRDAANRLTEHDGIPVEVRLEASPAMIEEQARAVALRVAQEALRNIAKHAGATRAWLFTRIEPATKGRRNDAWLLEVGDDGRGFDIEAPVSGTNRRHFGLRFMRERSDLLGARLSIDSRPAAGTVVRLSIDTRGKGSPRQ